MGRTSAEEFELKLIGTAADVAAVPRLVLADAALAGPVCWERLGSLYYDTPDLDLRAAGVSLRIRDEAGRKTLVLKAAGPGPRNGDVTPGALGAIIRSETSRPFTDKSDFSKLGESKAGAAVAALAGKLTPIARTTTQRWSSIAKLDGGLVEVSAELGRAERLTGDAVVSPIAEVELELLKGDPAAAFVLARRLIQTSDGRLRLTVQSKLDRALAGGRGRLQPRKNAFPGDDVATALAPTALELIDGAPPVLDAKAARKLRAALRRLRVFGRWYRPAPADDRLRKISDEAREFSRLLGAVRDREKFCAKCARLAPALLERGEADLAKAWFDVTQAFSGKTYALFALDLAEYALAPRLLGAARVFSEKRLAEHWASILRYAASADLSTPAALHGLRRRLRKFRIAAQFSDGRYAKRSRYAKRNRRFLIRLAAIQKSLGRVSDAIYVCKAAERYADGAGADIARQGGFLAGYCAMESEAAAAAARKDWQKLVKAYPFWAAPDAWRA